MRFIGYWSNEEKNDAIAKMAEDFNIACEAYNRSPYLYRDNDVSIAVKVWDRNNINGRKI